MPRNWSIPRASYDALGQMNIQRSPAIDMAIWASRADPTKLIRAMQARMTEALSAGQASNSAQGRNIRTSQDQTGDSGPQPLADEQAAVLQRKAVTGSKLVNGDEYVRVSVSYPQKTEEAVEYLSKLLKLSYEETVRLALEAYIKHL